MDANIVKALTSFVPQLLPEFILGVAACILFLGGTWRPSRCLWGWVAIISLALAGLGLWRTIATAPTVESQAAAAKKLGPDEAAEKTAGLEAERFAAPVLNTALAQFTRMFALVLAALLVLFAWDDVPDSHAAEYHACILLIAAGTGLTAAANDLITLFVALELVSIPTYVLLYLPRTDQPAREAAMKYFYLSIFSSALLLFGFSYLYGVAGSTNLAAIADALKQGPASGAARGVVLVALVLVLAGLGFRITAVPFHFYAPDVYQGTSTPNAALLAVFPKVGGFLALIRILALVPSVDAVSFDSQIPVVLWIMAAVTMSLGNILALLQDNIKRLLAYSSVAHSGYMLLGLTAATRLAGHGDATVGGVEGILFYLVAYGAMTVGAFAVLTYLSTPERTVENVDDLAGLGRNRPGVALMMTVFLFSLIGMPLTAGFAGKFYLFFGAMNAPFVTAPIEAADPAKMPEMLEQHILFNRLVLIASLNAAIGGYYYLRMIGVMYLRESTKAAAVTKRRPIVVTLGVCVVVTLAAGVYPKPLMDSVRGIVRGPVEEHKAVDAAAVR